MTAVRTFTAALAVLVLVAATDLLRPETAGADTPAPIPTTLSIRDASAPPTPSTQPQPFVSRPTRHRAKRAGKPRRPVASSKAQQTSVPAPTAQNPAAPRLEQRYQAPTEAIYPLEPEPAPAKAPEPKPASGGFPPEPAAAKK